MRANLLIFITINVLFFQSVQAEEAPTPAGLAYCTVCHGSQLKGNENIKAPRLSGLSDWYIERQLRNFKSGKRGSHPADKAGNEMMLMVGELSDEQISEVASWVTKTESIKPEPTIKGDVHLGEKLYKSCAVCHGENADGNKAFGAPRLTGLNDWYVANQLNNFRLGYRGTDESDMYGQLMKASSKAVTSEEDAANLATYIYQLNNLGVKPMKKTLIAAASTLLMSSAMADVTRHALPNNNPFPISRAVEVTPDTTLIFHSGMVPGPVDATAKKGSRKYYGDTETQALNVFKRFEASFKELGVDFGDVIKMQVFMVGDPMTGKMDFSGFMKAYTKYFGTEEQPNKPARSAFQIAGLAGGPNMLIEIEMVIAKPK